MEKALMIALMVFLVAFGMAGCVSLTPQQEAIWKGAQPFVDAVVKEYGTKPVTLMVGSHARGMGGTMREEGLLTVDPSWLKSQQGLELLLAHEMAHWIRDDHKRRRDLWREMWQNRVAFYERWRAEEFETDLLAVEILRRVKGLDEAQAVDRLYRQNRGLHELMKKGQATRNDEHHPPCLKIQLLRERFPAQRERLKECVD